jgi:hypothetical protein
MVILLPSFVEFLRILDNGPLKITRDIESTAVKFLVCVLIIFPVFLIPLFHFSFVLLLLSSTISLFLIK